MATDEHAGTGGPVEGYVDIFEVPDGELLTAAVAEFESRAHRDAVMDRVMKDPRVTEMVEGDQIADMSQMRYGGFQTLVNP